MHEQNIVRGSLTSRHGTLLASKQGYPITQRHGSEGEHDYELGIVTKTNKSCDIDMTDSIELMSRREIRQRHIQLLYKLDSRRRG